MITFDEALRRVMQSAVLLGDETAPLTEACGRVLSRDVVSDVDMPPFDKSAMDGYACRAADLDRSLTIIETIPAGRAPQRIVHAGECAKIMTGAILPEGADTVVMVEHADCEDGTVIVRKKSSSRNIACRAEDIRKGDTVLRKGTIISPADVAVLASAGCDPAPVSRRPVLGVLATGSELVEPAVSPGVAQIRNSNSYQLVAQAQRAGCVPRYAGIVEDTPEAMAAAIDRGAADADVLLITGGVSMGEYDYVPGILRQKGFELLFEKVAIKPGKPTVFGAKDSCFVFGLPGNPVSTFIVFELLVKPFCYARMGAAYAPMKITAQLTETIQRKKTGRLSFMPVIVAGNGTVTPAAYHGSAHIHALSQANGILSMPVGVHELTAGEIVDVIICT